jgi:hypothetical protein
MTGREKNLAILVGAVVLIVLGYKFVSGDIPSPWSGGAQNTSLEGAYRLLRSELNVTARSQAINKRLDALQAKFLEAGNPEESRIKLLKEVENLVAQSNLEITQKNLVQINKSEIGVTLEGKTKPESLFRFIWQTTQAQIGLKISRLQIHSLTEQKTLGYQIVVSTLLVDKKGK